MPATPPRVLTIAGSDSGGGAGIQADLKTFAAHGVYGMSVVTAVTAQNTVEVSGVEAIAPELVRRQIDAVFADLGVDAVKIGMLANAGVAAAVAEALGRWLAERPGTPVVLDPVMVAKSGAALLEPAAVDVLEARVLPLATLITPNLPEAERLAGRRASGESERRALAESLAERGPAVLLKGGHAGGDEIVDWLVAGGVARRFAHPRRATSSTHGTGCTLSSAIAARLAGGEALEEAVGGAIDYLDGALRHAYPLGAGHGPVDHLYGMRHGGR